MNILFPGHFDPFTLAHQDMVSRALKHAENIHILVVESKNKKPFHDLNKRLEGINAIYESEKRVQVSEWRKLLVDYLELPKNKDLSVLRGLRSNLDFDYELNLFKMNCLLKPDFESFFMMTKPEYSGLSSSFVRELWAYGRSADKFVDKAYLESVFSE